MNASREPLLIEEIGSRSSMRQDQVMERLILILRRDLKLGPDVPIDARTPLMGGDYDLDSLDILMLLTSVEKEFGIKIPNEAVRREAFSAVGVLAAYIEELRG